MTSDYYYFFLIWNLFLAGVPFLISEFVKSKSAPAFNSLVLIIWLLFLPNSFYVITDLIHLQNSSMQIFDCFMILSFAILCLYLGFYSMKKVGKWIGNKLPILNKSLLNILILFLCSFGIYLGRVLRYNSWDILKNPVNLAKDFLNFLRFPFEHFQVWLFTFIFGLMLTGLYYIFLVLTKQANAIE